MKRISSSIAATLALTLLATSLSACSDLLRRSDASGYGYRSAIHDEALGYRADRDDWMREQAAGEIGLGNTRELNPNEKSAVGVRVRLKEAERHLEGQREREQYFRHKPLMQSDGERLEFLRLPTYEARARWLNARGISATNPHHPPAIQKLIEQNDITLGMTRQAVRESWGEPELVEIAGNPLYGNERWKYLEQLSSPEGYRTEARMIYFESGRVAGWEKK